MNVGFNPTIELFRGRTIVEAPATEHTEGKRVGCCKKHKGVPLWQQRWYGGIKVFNPVCPLCEMEFCRAIEADSSGSIKKEAEKLGEMARHYEQLGATLEDQCRAIAFLGEELYQIKSDLTNNVTPSKAIDMRLVVPAIEGAMAEIKERFEKQDEAMAANRTNAQERARALYENIADAKRTFLAFQNKSDEAQGLASEALQSTVDELNRLAKQLDHSDCKWGEDIEEVRGDLELARAHIGSLQVELKEAKVGLRSQVQEAIRSFCRRSVSLETRMEELQAQVSNNTSEIVALNKRVAELEAEKADRAEIERLQEQIAQLGRHQGPVIRATVTDDEPSQSDDTGRERAPERHDKNQAELCKLQEEITRLRSENRALRAGIQTKELESSAVQRRMEKWEREARQYKAELEVSRKANAKLREFQGQINESGTKQTRELEAGVESMHLKRRVEALEQEAHQYKSDLEVARKELKEFSRDARMSHMLGMLQQAARRGGDVFPNIDVLKRQMKQCQDHVCTFFLDLADVYAGEPSTNQSENEYEIIFNRVLTPCASIVRVLMDEFLTTRREKLGEAEFSMVDGSLDDSFLCRYPHIGWASRKDIVNHDEIEGDVPSFMKILFLLELECKLCDPPCFLWPPVGRRQPFAKSRHSQKHLNNTNKSARDGDEVVVLFPGIYHSDPTKNDRLEPRVKAKVILFE